MRSSQPSHRALRPFHSPAGPDSPLSQVRPPGCCAPPLNPRSPPWGAAWQAELPGSPCCPQRDVQAAPARWCPLGTGGRLPGGVWAGPHLPPGVLEVGAERSLARVSHVWAAKSQSSEGECGILSVPLLCALLRCLTLSNFGAEVAWSAWCVIRSFCLVWRTINLKHQ